MTLNGKQIPNSIRNYKLNWASHGTSRHHQNQNQDGSANPGGGPGMHRMGSQMSDRGGPGGPPGSDSRMGGVGAKGMGGGPVGGPPGSGMYGSGQTQEGANYGSGGF